MTILLLLRMISWHPQGQLYINQINKRAIAALELTSHIYLPLFGTQSAMQCIG